jgi:hypothetical protein
MPENSRSSSCRARSRRMVRVSDEEQFRTGSDQPEHENRQQQRSQRADRAILRARRRRRPIVAHGATLREARALYRWFVRNRWRREVHVSCNAGRLRKRSAISIAVATPTPDCRCTDGGRRGRRRMEMLRQLSATIPSLPFDSFAHGLHEQQVGDARLTKSRLIRTCSSRWWMVSSHPGSRTT